MGIDTHCWLCVQTEARLEAERHDPGALVDPRQDALYLLSLLAPAGPRAQTAASYLKNGSPIEMAAAMDPIFREHLRAPQDRAFFVSAIEDDYVAIGWSHAESGGLRRREVDLDLDAMPEVFEPEENATCCAILAIEPAPDADVRLAKALPAELKDGVRRALADAGIFFWDGELAGTKGLAVAIHKFASAAHRHPILIPYQTAIEGAFAWVTREGHEWPRHVRWPFGFAEAPGDLPR